MTTFTKWVFITVFLVGLVFGQGARAQSADVMNMEVGSIAGNCDSVVVTTTGAEFTFTSNRIEIKARINVGTNSFYANPSDYVTTARLNLVGLDITPFRKESYDLSDPGENTSALCSFSNADLVTDNYGKDKAIIYSNKAKFEIHNNGLLFISAKAEFAYNAINMLPNPGWDFTGVEKDINKNPIVDVVNPSNNTPNRIWAKTNIGGSLHAVVAGSPTFDQLQSNLTHINMSLNTGGNPAEPPDEMAHMIFPARLYDFKLLYGEGFRPFVQTVGGLRVPDFLDGYGSGLSIPFRFFNSNLDEADNGFDENIDKKRHVGVFFVSATIYEGAVEDDTSVQRTHPQTISISHNSQTLTRGYVVDDDRNATGRQDQDFRDFITAAHSRGFKVIAYTIGPAITNWCESSSQAYDNTGAPTCPDLTLPVEQRERERADKVLAWMDYFQKEYKTDGWYVDGPDVGNFKDDYYFTRKLRKQVDDNNNDHANYPEIQGNIILYHDSIDPWSENETDKLGLKAVFLRTYADYSLSGELGSEIENLHAKVSKPNEDYYKFYTNGYGMDQAICSHKLFSVGTAKLQEEDNARALGENYYCAHRSKSISLPGGVPKIDDEPWEDYFLPQHEKVRTGIAADVADGDYAINSIVPPTLGNSSSWYKSYTTLQTDNILTIDDANNPVGNFSFKFDWDLYGVNCSHDEGTGDKINLDLGTESFRGAKISLDEGTDTNWEKKHKWIQETVHGPLINREVAGTLIADTVSDTNIWKHTATFNGVPPGNYKLMLRCETFDLNVTPQKVFQYSNNTLSVDAVGNVTIP